MPELPEVNTVQKGFRKVAMHNKIDFVEIFDSKILRNIGPDDFSSFLTGKQFVDTFRQGKYFFGILKNGHSVLFHLGMTGDIEYHSDAQDFPRFERFRFRFSDGLILSFTDQRKFSSILYLENLQAYLKEIKLGPDALKIDETTFIKLFDGRKAPLKSLLMNQRLIAGIGNLYSDEICYQTRLHPLSIAGALKKSHRLRLYKTMKDVLNLACARDAYYQVYPDDWFWKWRQEGATAPDGKSLVKKVKVGGRTTYFAEGYQKLFNSIL